MYLLDITITEGNAIKTQTDMSFIFRLEPAQNPTTFTVQQTDINWYHRRVVALRSELDLLPVTWT